LLFNFVLGPACLMCVQCEYVEVSTIPHTQPSNKCVVPLHSISVRWNGDHMVVYTRSLCYSPASRVR